MKTCSGAFLTLSPTYLKNFVTILILQRTVASALSTRSSNFASRTWTRTRTRPHFSPQLFSSLSGMDDLGNSHLLLSKINKLNVDGDEGGGVHLILASQSPRRREILDMMGLSGRYTVSPSPLDESKLQSQLSGTVTPEVYSRTLAEHKAKALGDHLMRYGGVEGPLTLILGSDTIVELEGKILEKPKDESEAIKMVTTLAGQWHRVHTGVAIYSISSQDQETTLVSSFTDTTKVKFANLSAKDIEAYVATGEPMDKAGAYGIQGIGGQLVETLSGDFFTVMGLPMHRVSRELGAAISKLS